MDAIRCAMTQSVKQFITHPLLHALNERQITRRQFQVFAVERHLATAIFVPLLERLLLLATQASNELLVRVVADNLADETGMRLPAPAGYGSMSHAIWRADYLRALGLDPTDKPTPSLGACAYEAHLRTLLTDEDYRVLAGALLFLEASIPPEFQRIRRSRDDLFPEAFVLNKNDSCKKREAKRRGRFYLDDHIIHDATDHLPRLRAAVEQTDPESKLIIQGIIRAKAAKLALYDGVSMLFNS